MPRPTSPACTMVCHRLLTFARQAVATEPPRCGILSGTRALPEGGCQCNGSLKTSPLSGILDVIYTHRHIDSDPIVECISLNTAHLFYFT
jgi:hypothetical protein